MRWTYVEFSRMTFTMLFGCAWSCSSLSLAMHLRPGLIEGECMENILPNGHCFADVMTKMRHAVLTIPLDSPRSPFSIPPMMMSSSFTIGLVSSFHWESPFFFLEDDEVDLDPCFDVMSAPAMPRSQAPSPPHLQKMRHHKQKMNLEEHRNRMGKREGERLTSK